MQRERSGSLLLPFLLISVLLCLAVGPSSVMATAKEEKTCTKPPKAITIHLFPWYSAKYFYYDEKKMKCVKFTYLVIYSKVKNYVFPNEADCKKKCVDKCKRMPDNNKMCFNTKQLYFYNSEERKCEEHYTNSCGSDDHGFEDKNVCEDVCSICQRPQTNATCGEKDMKRFWFFYDPKAATCQRFRGCKGKGRGSYFRTKTACQEKCTG